MIFNWFKWFKKQEPPIAQIVTPLREKYDDPNFVGTSRTSLTTALDQRYFGDIGQFFNIKRFTSDGAISQSVSTFDNMTLKYSFEFQGDTVPTALLQWYGAQSFIGFQVCSMMYQQWMIAKACNIPGLDALRKGYKITVNSGVEVDPKILDEMRDLDADYRINEKLAEFESRCRIFGIRIAIFQFRDADDEFYANPYNPDAITPNSYIGILQVDPQWITPELDMRSAGDPSYEYFLEPTWWVINGRRYHRTHLVVIRHEAVPDIIKPAYFFGGLSIPQKIYERVYNAERAATEGVMLLMTKRTQIKKVDMSKAIAQEQAFRNRLNFASFFRDNYGTDVIDTDEDITHFETSLSDLDQVIKGQYDLVASAADMPVTKFMGASPSGLNASGNYEESSYHELLGIIKEGHYTPFLKRHYENLLLSHICPKYGIDPFTFKIEWEKSDELTEKEAAEVNKIKAETASVYATIGALNGEDIRQQIVNDPKSGYDGLSAELPVDEAETELFNEEETDDN